MSVQTPKRSLTLRDLQEMRGRDEPIAGLTAYDATQARLVDESGADFVLVGDSLGMVVLGHDTTIPVTLEDMIHHTRAVSRGVGRALLMADMPFMSYTGVDQAVHTAARLMQEGGARMVKLEGDAQQVDVVRALAGHGIPVCAHLGLRPQSVHKLGGYRVQGRGEAAAERMLSDALALQGAGADLLLLECVPAPLAGRIRAQSDIPVIGIGAGSDCDGQVLVYHDILGISPHSPRFSRNFLAGAGSIQVALAAYVAAVKGRQFPAAEHAFSA